MSSNSLQSCAFEQKRDLLWHMGDSSTGRFDAWEQQLASYSSWQLLVFNICSPMVFSWLLLLSCKLRRLKAQFLVASGLKVTLFCSCCPGAISAATAKLLLLPSCHLPQLENVWVPKKRRRISDILSLSRNPSTAVYRTPCKINKHVSQ
jgi:hypothetical protein